MSILSRLSFYFWYLRHPPWDSGITPPEFLEFLKDQHPGHAIDLGCGTGTNAITMAKLGWQVDGVDFVPRAIEAANKKALKEGLRVNLRVGDVTRLSGFDGPYDLALDLGCYHGLSGTEKAAYLHQLDRVLPPGGIWFLYAFLSSPGAADSSTGLSAFDLEHISTRFVLQTRIDGYDRGRHPSAYFIFEKSNIGG